MGSGSGGADVLVRGEKRVVDEMLGLLRGVWIRTYLGRHFALVWSSRLLFSWT